MSCDEETAEYLACMTCAADSEEECSSSGETLVCEGFTEVCTMPTNKQQSSKHSTFH